MNKAELIEKMAKEAKITKAAAGRALDSFIDGVTKGLKKRNSKVTLVGFGTFYSDYRIQHNEMTPPLNAKEGAMETAYMIYKPYCSFTRWAMPICSSRLKGVIMEM